MESSVYIYGLYDPRTNALRYVGKTVDPKTRYNDHLTQLKARTRKVNWIKSLRALNLQPTMRTLDIVPESWSNTVERYYIKFWREKLGNQLTNGTDGGDGGAITNPDARERIRQAHLGTKHSDDHKRKISESHKRRCEDPAERKRMSETAKRIGLIPPRHDGENSSQSKLTDIQIREIRIRSCAGELGSILSEEYGLSRSQITDIATGKTRVSAGGPIRKPK